MESPGENTMILEMMGNFHNVLTKDIEKRKREQQKREQQGDLLTARGRIASLEAEMEMMKANTRKAKMEVDDDVEKLKRKLEMKTDAVADLQRQLEFVLKHENQLKHDLEEERNNKSTMRGQFNDQVKDLREKKLKLETMFQDLQFSSRDTISKLSNDLTKKDTEIKLLQTDLEEATTQMRYHMKRGISASSQRRALDECTAQLVNAQLKIKILEQQIEAQKDSVAVAKAVQSEAQKVNKLEQENTKLKQENAYYRETCENNTLLKEKMNGLEAKLVRSEERSTEFAQLQVENEDLKSRLQRWEALSGDQPSRPKSPSEMVQRISELQRGQVNLLEQQGQYMASAHSHEEAHKATKQDLISMNQKLVKEQERTKQQEDLVKRLQRRLLMLTKERDGMRQILHSYDAEVTHSGFQQQSNSRLKQAEENVDLCHQQIEQLDSALAKSTDEAGQYRLQVKQLELELTQVKDELTTTKGSLASMEARGGGASGENEDLKKKVEELEAECKKLAERNEVLEVHMERSALKGDYDPTKTKIVTFSMNPAAMAKKQRGEELENLRAECETLRQRVRVLEESAGEGTSSESVESRIREEQTRAVQDVKKELELSELRNQRLKEVFAQKIQEFRQACYQLTGYQINSPTSNQYKLLSMFAESPNDILHFQMTPAGEMSLLANDFSSSLSHFVDEFLLRGNSIPAFLSTVTLDLFSRQTVMR